MSTEIEICSLESQHSSFPEKEIEEYSSKDRGLNLLIETACPACTNRCHDFFLKSLDLNYLVVKFVIWFL